MLKIMKVVGTHEIEEAIKDNEGYCVCAVDKNPDTKCMCKAFRDMQEEGLCHCGLYIKYKIDKD